jgi:hypothetical protein
MIQTPINSFNVANVIRNLCHSCGYSDRIANPAKIIPRGSGGEFLDVLLDLALAVEPDHRSSVWEPGGGATFHSSEDA